MLSADGYQLSVFRSIEVTILFCEKKTLEQNFDAPERLSAMRSYVLNKGESFDLEAFDRQMVRNYGYYSNVSRGECRKNEQNELILRIPEPDESYTEYRENRAPLIQKINY